MPGLPDRPDLNQLRRQARELLRAASGGEPTAVARIRAVSARTTLSAAQLALAREHGCRNWAALRAEAERRRSHLNRWSFGGAAAIEILSGWLLPEGLAASSDMAVLFTSLTPRENDAWPEALAERLHRTDEALAPGDEEARAFDEEIQAWGEVTGQAGDITVADNQGTTYTLRALRGAYGPFRSSIWFRVEPVPVQGIEWLELGGQNGTAVRLLPSPRAVVRLGRLTPVTASPAERELTRGALSAIALRLDAAAAGPWDHGIKQHCDALLARTAEIRRAGELDAASDLPGQLERLCSALTWQRPDEGLSPAWAAMLDAAERADGPPHHLDLGITLPPIDGMTLQLASLLSAPTGWSLPLRANPRWPGYRDSQRRKRSAVELSAKDDLGCLYVCKLGGGSGRDGYEELSPQFRPRLDPLARRLRLTFTGSSEQIAIDLDLASGALGRG
jgi:hypothetical protein